MHRLFNQFRKNETEITTKLYCSDREGANSLQCFSFESDYKQCSSAKDFGDVYNSIQQDIGRAKLHVSLNLEIEIQLSGKLNGNDFTQKFRDLDTYRQFLEKNSLIKSTGCYLFSHHH